MEVLVFHVHWTRLYSEMVWCDVLLLQRSSYEPRELVFYQASVFFLLRRISGLSCLPKHCLGMGRPYSPHVGVGMPYGPWKSLWLRPIYHSPGMTFLILWAMESSGLVTPPGWAGRAFLSVSVSFVTTWAVQARPYMLNLNCLKSQRLGLV